MENLKRIANEVRRNRSQAVKLHEENIDRLSEASLHIESVLLDDFLRLEDSLHKRFNALEDLLVGLADYIIHRDDQPLLAGGRRRLKSK